MENLLDIVQNRRKELQAQRANAPTEYIKAIAQNANQVKTLMPEFSKSIESSLTENTQRTITGILNSPNEKNKSVVFNKIKDSLEQNNTTLLSLVKEMRKSRDDANLAAFAAANRSSGQNSNVQSMNSQGGGGSSAASDVMDLLGSGGGPKGGPKGSKMAGVGKLLGRAGTIGALGFAAYDAYDALTDNTLTKTERNTKVGGAGGMAAGALAGGQAGLAVGAALAPFTAGISLAVAPVLGSLAGAFIGSKLGEEAGANYEKFSTYMENELAPTITKSLSGIDTFVGTSQKSMMTNLSKMDDMVGATQKGMLDMVTNVNTNVGTWLKGLGASVPDSVKGVVDTVKDIGTQAGKVIAEGAQTVKDTMGKAYTQLTSPTTVAQVPPAVVAAGTTVAEGAQTIGTSIGDAMSNIKANAKGRANWQKNGGAITDAALRYGIDPKVFAQTSYVESDGFRNSATPGNSSASGLFQFLDGTWIDTVAKHGNDNPETAGLTSLAQMAKQKYGGPKGLNVKAARNDPALAALFDAKTDTTAGSLMGAAFTKDNIDKLAKVGIDDPTGAQMYSMHVLGNSKLAQQALKDPSMTMEDAVRNKIIGQKQIDDNGNMFKGSTVGDSMKELERRVNWGVDFGDSALKLAQGATTNSMMGPLKNISGSVSDFARMDAVDGMGQNIPTGMKLAIAKATQGIVDGNPMLPPAMVNVGNLPPPTPMAVIQPDLSSNNNLKTPTLDGIPIRITDTGIILMAVGQI